MLKNGGRNALRMSLCMALTACFAPNAFGDLVVESWSLNVGVLDVTPPASPSDSAYFQNVQNPFQNTHTATIPGSYASASYDFSWSGDSAHFDLTTTHYVQQLRGRTGTEGSIYIRPTVDTNISFNGSWQFSWPAVILGQTSISLVAYDVNADQVVAFAHAGGGNVGLGQPYGDLHVQNNGLLLAGGLYLIHYITQIDQLTPTPPPGTHGEGSGEIHFSLTPVPEPTTAALIGILLLPQKSLDRRQQRR